MTDSNELVFDTPVTIETNEAPAPQTPKKKKGRPSKKELEERAKNGETAPEKKVKADGKISDPFEQLKKDIEENERNNINASQQQAPPVTEAPPVNNLLSGYILLLGLDLFFPSAIKMIFKKAAKDISVSQLRLSKEQHETLEPLADEVAKRIQQYIDPITLFFIAAGGMYYFNFTEAAEKKTEK